MPWNSRLEFIVFRALEENETYFTSKIPLTGVEPFTYAYRYDQQRSSKLRLSASNGFSGTLYYVLK